AGDGEFYAHAFGDARGQCVHVERSDCREGGFSEVRESHFPVHGRSHTGRVRAADKRRFAVRYVALCSGIGDASVAWKALGWWPVAFSEIAPFPCAVLFHHYPDVPNLGDMAEVDGRLFRGIDLLVGGTPCQEFSIAGKRSGLEGARSGLAREFVRILGEAGPRWFVWENVPGVLSVNGGRDF